MKFILTILSFLCLSQVIVSQTDSLLQYDIDQVVLLGNKTKEFTSVNRIITIDSMLAIHAAGSDLVELLSNVPGIGIKSYGSVGSASTVRMRGMSGKHVTVLWNGFPINSLTLGEMDMASLAVNDFSEITVIPGASGSLFGSGTFGGAIVLESKPKWNSKELKTSYSRGSFNYQKGQLGITLGNKNISFISSANWLNSENNYPFKNKSNEVLPMEHNRAKNFSLVNSLYIRHGKANIFSTSFWIQNRSKEIPATISFIKTYSNQFQVDKTIKFLVEDKLVGTNWALNLKSAYFGDYLKYTDKKDNSLSLNSEIKINRLFSEVLLNHYISNKFKFTSGVTNSINSAVVSEYFGVKTENNVAGFAGLQYESKWFLADGIIRSEIQKGYKIPVTWSFGHQIRAYDEKVILRTSYSSKFRVPPFNEKYWFPGGDINVKPETGWNYEKGVILYSPNRNSKIDITGFYSHILNMIQWVPNGGYYAVRNSQNVVSQGIESTFSNTFKSNSGLIVSTHLGYTYNDTHLKFSELSSNYKQLSYVPKHSGNLNFLVRYNDLGMNITNSFTGSYHTSENNYLINAYSISGASIFWDMKLYTKNIIGFELKILNILDKKYQVVNLYPMPGRAYYLTINLKI